MPVSRNLEIFESSTSLFAPLSLLPFYDEPELSSPLDLFDQSPELFGSCPSPFDLFDDGVLGLTHFETTPFSSCSRRIRSMSALDPSLMMMRSLGAGVSALEFPLEKVREADRKYTWSAEIKCPERKWLDRKYKLTAEVKGGDDRKYKLTAEIEKQGKSGVDGKYKWTAEIKGGKQNEVKDSREGKLRGAEIKIKAETGSDKKKKERNSAGGVSLEAAGKAQKKTATRVVEIGGPHDQGAIFLRQAFSKRGGAVARKKGKAKELSPQAAAQMIQGSFRAYLIRRSQALRSLRELAVSKTELKEIRALFNNFSYRQRIARDAEERKRFMERIISLLLNVDAIQGADLMVRAARKSMLDELEAMLDAADPHPHGKFGCIRRKKTTDAPECSTRNEIAGDVAEVGQYDNSAFEVCL